MVIDRYLCVEDLHLIHGRTLSRNRHIVPDTLAQLCESCPVHVLSFALHQSFQLVFIVYEPLPCLVACSTPSHSSAYSVPLGISSDSSQIKAVLQALTSTLAFLLISDSILDTHVVKNNF